MAQMVKLDRIKQDFCKSLMPQLKLFGQEEVGCQ